MILEHLPFKIIFKIILLVIIALRSRKKKKIITAGSLRRGGPGKGLAIKKKSSGGH